MRSSTSASPRSKSQEGRSREQQQTNEGQSHGRRQNLGPCSLSEAGGMGNQGDRAARAMYIDYFEERERVRGMHGV